MAAWNLQFPVLDSNSENQRATSEAIRSVGDSFADAYASKRARQDRIDEAARLRQEKAADRMAAIEDSRALEIFSMAM